MTAQARFRVAAAAGLAGAVASLWLMTWFAPSPWTPVLLHMLLAEHVAIHLVLALSFGLTLRPGVQPLIARAAARLHGGLTPAKERYTRKVTLAWTLYFVAMAIVSIALHAALPFRLWALYANIGTPLAVAAMFAGEAWLRYRLHPEFERSSARDMIMAFRQSRRTALLPPAGGAGR